MAVDPSIPLQTQSFDMLGMLGRGSELAKFYAQQKTDGELNRIYNESQGDLTKMLDLGKQSKLSRFVVPQIQSQISAQSKSYTDQLKAEADIAKTSSEAFKNNQQGQGYGVDNSQKKFGAIQGVFQQAAMTGDKGQVLLGLDALKRTGAITPEDYSHNFNIVKEMSPDDIKQYASGIGLSNKDVAPYLYQTLNNSADNATSSANNMRTTNASIYSTDIGAQTADKNRVQQDSQFQQNYTLNQQKAFFEQNKPTSYGYDTQGRQYAVLPNGKAVYVKDEQGGYVVGQQKGGKGLSEQQSKDALFGARMQESNAILNELESKGISQTVMSRLPWLGDSLSTSLPSVLGGANESQGKYMQARRDFINAVLRKESGAVIADSEFSNAEKQYFPQVGDSKEIIAQKARNRDLATKMILGSAGPVGQQLVNQVRGKEGASSTQPPLINSSSFMP